MFHENSSVSSKVIMVRQLCGQICTHADKESRIKIIEFIDKYKVHLEFQDLKDIDFGCPN